MIFALPKKTIFLYKLRLLCIISTALALLLCYPWQSRVFWAVFFVVVGALSIGFWYLIKRLKSFSLEINSQAVVASYGVFIKIKRIYPLSSIVYFGKIQTPLAKKRGLCAVLLKSVPKSLIIPEMLEKHALQVQKMVEKYNERNL